MNDFLISNSNMPNITKLFFACTPCKSSRRDDHYYKMAALKDVVSLYQNLKQEWGKNPCNLKKCGELLNQLKVRVYTSSDLIE